MKSIDRAAAEPFRVFFPLGVAASVVGVLLWPAYFAGWLETWPLEAHARWMVTGFAGCFITGFLGTAGPRLVGTEPWSRFELLWHLGMALAVMGCLACQAIGPADLLTGFWLIGVLASLGFRLLVGRRDAPPPGFPVAILGILGAALAAFVLSSGSVLSLSPTTNRFCRLLLFEGLLWLPILGVSPYLLPRFFGKPSRHSFPTSESIPQGWWKPFAASLLVGVAILASFALEAGGAVRSGMVLRAAVILAYLAGAVPGWLGFSKVNGLGLALRWVPISAASGWWLAVAFPPLRTGTLHMMFIGAAALLMLGVATRVTLGHAERHDRLGSKLRWLHAVWVLVLFTAMTRVVADFIPKIRVSHYIYAAVFWVLIVAFWAWKLRREMRMPVLEEDAPKGRCPKPSRQRQLGTAYRGVERP